MNQRPTGGSIWRVLVPLLLFWILNFVAQFIVSFVVLITTWMPDIMRQLDSGEITLTTLQTEVLPAQMSEIASYIMSYTPYIVMLGGTLVILYSVFAFRRDRVRDEINGIKVENTSTLKSYVLITGLSVAACVALNIIMIMLQLAFPNLSYSQFAGQFIFSAPLPIQILGFGVIAPIAEEFIFRGLIFKRYRERSAFGRSMIWSSLFFALVHQNTIQMIYAFILGILFAYVYEKFGTLKAPILFHVAVNLSSIMITYIRGINWVFDSPIRVAITVVISAFIASGLFVLIHNSQGEKIVK